MRALTLALGGTLALIATSCGDDDLDLDAIAAEVEADSEPTADDQTGSPTEDGSASSPTDDEQPTDGDDTGPEADTKPSLSTDAKSGTATLSKFFDAGLSDPSEECMVDGLVADPDLLAAILAVQPDGKLSDLSTDHQVAAVDLGLSCVTAAELSASIQADFDADVAAQALAGEAADCVSARLTADDNPDRTQLLLGLIAIDERRPATPEQSDLIIGLMTDCISPQFLIDAALESVVDDPLIGTALDRPCLDEAVESPGYLDQFWGLFIENSDVEFEDLPVDSQRAVISPFFDCISFGGVIAAVAAEEGVTLSEQTIACIDDALDSISLVDSFLSGSDLDEAELIGTVFPCLSVEELAGLG